MRVVFAILGLLLGLLLESPGTAILGVILGALLGDYLTLRRQLLALRGPARGLSAPPLPVRPGVADVPPAVDFQPEFDLEFVEPPLASPSPAPTPPWLMRLLSWLGGGNLAVRLGVLVLFFGVAFLLRYAAERDWLPIGLRLLGVAIGGLGLLALGLWLRQRRRDYALALQGGGLGICYLCGFVALRFYGLLPAELVFALLVLCMLLAGLLAVTQDARALAVLAAVGGFLAPVLASTGQGSHVALFGYYFLLNLGILGVSWYRAWRVLNTVGFVFTFAVASAWGYRYYSPRYFASVEPFLLAFVALYIAVAVLFASRQPPRLKGLVDGTLVFGTPLAGFGLQSALLADSRYGLAWSALGLGLAYLALVLGLQRHASEALKPLREAFLALAVVFLTLSIPLALDARWTAACWALEGAGLVWVGVRQWRRLARWSGTLLQLAAGVSHGLAGDAIGRGFPGGDYLGGVVLAAAGVASGYWLWQGRARLGRAEGVLEPLLAGWGLLWWLGASLAEIHRVLPRLEVGAVLVLVTITALVARLAREQRDWPLLRWPVRALGPALLVILGLQVLDGELRPLVDGGAFGWPLAWVIYLGLLHRREHHAPLDLPGRWSHALGLWLLAWLVAAELAGQLTRLAPAALWGEVLWGLLPALLLLVLTRSERLGWPLGRHAPAYQGLAAGGLLVFLGGWLLTANVLLSGHPATPLPYVPLLHPLDGVLVLGLGVLYHWLLVLGGLPVADRRVRFWWAVAAFWVLNGMLIRALHHWAGVDLSAAGLWSATLAQVAFTLLWAVSGLLAMLFGSLRQARRPWLAGAGLMAVVVAKLFVVDLAATGTLARIVGFLGVGVLLLVIGYFSPVPPRDDPAA